MKSSYSLFILLLTIFATCQSMEQQIIQFDSINDIREECFNLLEKLNAQPEFNNGETRCKAIPANYRLSRVTEIVCKTTRKKLGLEKAWHVYAVRSENCQIYLPDGNCMGAGLEKTLYDKYKPTECSLETLKVTITQTMHSIQEGWKQTTLSEFPDIATNLCVLPELPEQEWLLFVKPQLFYDEDTLFRCLTSLTNLRDAIRCNNRWNNNSEHDYNMLYLWIKITHVERILAALQLKVS